MRKITIEYENGEVREFEVATGDSLRLPPGAKIINEEDLGD